MRASSTCPGRRRRGGRRRRRRWRPSSPRRRAAWRGASRPSTTMTSSRTLRWMAGTSGSGYARKEDMWQQPVKMSGGCTDQSCPNESFLYPCICSYSVTPCHVFSCNLFKLTR
ncbi:cyclin-dependent kinase inhibitor 6 isoform 2 [Oryza sativa Japonica Group]|uniref:cDNA clone:001-112-D03, full insert sequence n=3 Tax=Oryza TaxID=4527 RepID=B7E896_ORYSJ|nr:cyclin-dependent kinase inhibitor 6 isoform 2 [Oryza sativa Japonica Group]EEC84708.1 hypothetical protein OsI_31663 [Oryza sativa Indica Group]BAG88593.1 unnamed protein product [Oryza sativa Japonica Group]